MHKRIKHRHRTPGKLNRLIKSGLFVAGAVAIFGVGWLSGSGRISFQRYQAVSSNDGLPAKLDYSSVDTIYRSLRENFDGELDETKLMEGIKKGLANATGDPYTEYFNPSAATEFQNSIDGTFEGIGAELGKDDQDNIIIVSPIAGYPAEKAGVKSRDIIAEVDGESTHGWTISQAVENIRGDKGTPVTLTIVRGNEVHEISIVRETIDIPSVESEIKDDIGYMTIIRFGDDTVSLAREAARQFKSAGVKGVVLDLRGNPGGYLEGAVDVSSLWLDPNATVLTERRDNVVIKTIRARGEAILKGVPTVVLVNEGSASASEITAGALRDNNVATVIGKQSFGKGSVQQPINLGDGGLLKVTIARWFTPDGKNIDREGIKPDQEVEVSAEDIAAGRDPQLQAALDKLQN